MGSIKKKRRKKMSKHKYDKRMKAQRCPPETAGYLFLCRCGFMRLSYLCFDIFLRRFFLIDPIFLFSFSEPFQ